MKNTDDINDINDVNDVNDINDSSYIEIVEIKPGNCERHFADINDAFIDGGNVPEIDPNYTEFDAFLGGDDLEINPNTYIIGGNEYVFDNVKFAFLQHLYDLEAGKSSTIDPDKLLNEMYTEAGNMLSAKMAIKDVICGFECFINGALLRLERAGKIKDIVAVIPPKPDFCNANQEADISAVYRYLSGFNIAIKLHDSQTSQPTQNTIDVKFDLPSYNETQVDEENIDISQIPESHPLFKHADIYAEFKATESRGKKMLSELIYLDSVMHIIVENINKLREIIATQI